MPNKIDDTLVNWQEAGFDARKQRQMEDHCFLYLVDYVEKGTKDILKIAVAKCKILKLPHLLFCAGCTKVFPKWPETILVVLRSI